MANIKNFGLVGVGSDVQFGKSGPRLINNSGVFAFRDSGNANDANITAGNLSLSGNLEVNGVTTTVNSTSITTADKTFVLSNGASTDSAANGSGFEVQGASLHTFLYDSANSAFTGSENLNIASAKQFMIAGVPVLSSTTLGSNVVNSGLTSVGTLTSLHVSGTSLLDGLVTAGAGVGVTGGLTTDTLATGNVTVAGSSTVSMGGNVVGNVATGVAGTDAVNVTQLTSAISAVSSGAIAALQTEVDTIEASIGLNSDGTLAAFQTGGAVAGKTTYLAAVNALDTALTAEVANRNTAITSAVSAEATARNTAIGVETTRAEAAELVLTNGLAAEISRAEAAEGVNASAISAEVTRAEGIEAGIQSQATAIEASVGLNSDGTLIAFTGAVTTGSESYFAAVTALDTALAAETARAEAAEAAATSANTTAVTAETTRAEGIENAIIASVGLTSTGTLAAFQTGGAVAGKTTYLAAVNALDTALSAASAATASEVTRAEAAELVLTNGLSAEITRATGAEGTLTSNLSAEVSRATAAEGVIAGNLATEVTRAEAAETALGLRITDLTTDAVAEGTTNLYFTATRARAALSVDTTTGHTGLLYNSTTGVFGVDQTVIATVAAMTAGDAATLASAEAYTDSKVAGKTQYAGQAAYAAFTFASTAVTVAPAITGLVHRVKVYVATAFTDATSGIQVGTSVGGTLTANTLVATTDTDPTIAACYVVELAVPVSAADLVVSISAGASTAGAGTVVIEWI